MSRRPAIEVEDDDEFDDDTDLPLPSNRTLVNTGIRGALLEEIGSESSVPSAPYASSSRTSGGPRTAAAASSGSATPSSRGPTGGPAFMSPDHPLYSQYQAASGGKPPVMIDADSPEAEQYKRWTCVYPIYIDAKRAYATGGRKVARDKSIWWPRSQDISVAAASLGFKVLHEPTKAHPKDFNNPGRVKVLWKLESGQLTNPSIPTKKLLFEKISESIQRSKPTQVPDLASLSLTDENKPVRLTSDKKYRKRPLPKPPLPLPPLQERYSIYSPLISSGMLLDGWKVGSDKPPITGGADAGQGGTGSAGTGGKGKRKVIRVRG